ncbi:flagellar protein FliT [Clostridium beijerinckii]|uniref:flagellar protein FliT n=1 Tax=Clostridium beijerinckii TaxID=1520 RepID=UPI0006BB4B57|nr:flagellar protein FliT [Clostridium beijerinckii]ALB44524.1 flagellar protein FliT [Clostridium beijerinckii NRRL B-598]
MNEKLQNYLVDFKEFTMEMISKLKSDDIDNFEIALKKRTQIIEEINNLCFEHSEFKKISEELDIVNVNDQLSEIVSEKRDEIKGKIIELKKSQNANNAYHSNFNMGNVFSKKV